MTAGGGRGEPQLPGLKVNVCPYSGTLVQTGTGASLPPREQSHPWESKGAAGEGLTLWEGGADCNGGNTMFWPPLPLSIQYPKSLSVTTPQGIELQQAHFTEKVIKAQSEGMLPYPSSLTSSDSGTSAAPDRCPSQGGSFSCLLLCLSHASTCLVSEVLPHLDSCP